MKEKSNFDHEQPVNCPLAVPLTQEYIDQHVVTVRCNARGVSRKEWMLDMIKWADDHDIMINRWIGDSSHSVGDSYWHEVQFAIEEPSEKIMFLLRWT